MIIDDYIIKCALGTNVPSVLDISWFFSNTLYKWWGSNARNGESCHHIEFVIMA